MTVFLYRYGERAGIENYVKALTAVGFEVCAHSDIQSSGTCDALLLSGGGDSDPALYGQKNRFCRNLDPARDRAEMALVRRFAALKKPILGICRGHQLLNFTFGGDLFQDLASAENHMQQDGRDQNHETTLLPGSLLYDLYGEKISVTSAHHQGVDHPGRGFRAVQWAPDGVVEAMEHESLPILAVQWHPERQFAGEGALAPGRKLFEAFYDLAEKKAEDPLG